MAGRIVTFAKVAADLDSHPKIREAGRDGREVFLFALRKNAAHDFNGCVPALYFKPKYLADQLMMDEVTACHGLNVTVTAGLLTVTDDGYLICGWDDEWAKRPLTDTERKRRSRSKTSNPINIDSESRNVTMTNVTSVTDRDGHRSEKSREEKNTDVPAPPDECLALADQLRTLVLEQQPTNQLSKKPWEGRSRTAWGRTFDLITRVDQRPADEIRGVIDWIFHRQTGDARFVVQSPDALREKWDRITQAMNRPVAQNPQWQKAQTEIRQIKRLTDLETAHE